MATSAYASTPDTTNANRASRVLLGPCSDQLRDVLRRRVNPINFPHVIRRNRPNLPRLTLPQKDLILPRIGHYSGDYSDMDISLLYLLLRNICNIQPHLKGWGNSPNVTDHSLAASIERIHEARNKMGHSSCTSLSDNDFKGLWSHIKDAVKSIDAFLNNGKKYEKEMDFLLTETMDPEQEDFYREQLRKEVEEEARTRETIMRLQESVDDQQGNINDLHSQQQKSYRQLRHQQMGIEGLRYQQQLSYRQLRHQRRGIQDLRYQQQESCRQLSHHQWNIQNLRYQQQESNRQLTHQQRGIQDLRYQQQELHRELTHHQGGIQDLLYQQQESNRQLAHQQWGIQGLRYQQQELERQHTDQYTTLTDRVQTHSDQIADLTQRMGETLVIPDEEPDVSRLKERLVKVNDLEIPLTPLQEDSDKLPVEQLFASVIIKDSKETRKGKKSAQDGKEQERKEVKTPEDMLTKNGKPVRRVYMLGDAAHGKTTYCTWLLKKWCNAQKPGMSGRPLNEWENALSQFDFIFHLKFRHVDPSRSNVTDMICQDILGEDTGLHTAAKHVLSSDKYRCLIIMDGLDEWKSDQSAIAQLKYKGMPNIDNMSNCVIFTTMRPWMFAAVAGLVRDDERVIEIQGLDDKGIRNVIYKVLVHYYEMEPDRDEYTGKYSEIISKLKDKTLKSFIHIPLLAVVCIQIWCEGEQVGDSLTSFYVAMVNMLIERAQVKNQIPKLSRETTNLSLPRILSAKKNINSFSNVLLKLGKVAYEGLISKQMKLVFQKDNLENEIGERELQFALDVGLISQTEAHSITTRKVSVHFFQKSVQEFLAVIYIVTQKKVSDTFCTRLCNVQVIMELSNVIMFICGMCPSLGSVISQLVVSVADSDGEICKCRGSLYLDNYTVKDLYKLQVSWYREFQYGKTDSPVTQTDSPVTQTDSPVKDNPVTQTESPVTDNPVTQTDSPVTQTDSPVTDNPVTQTDSPVKDNPVTQTESPVTQTDSPVTDSPVTFHVSDVYLDYDSDTETVRVTRELLSGHHDIRSLTLWWVPTDGDRGITDTELGDFLSNTDKTRSLVRFCINCDDTYSSVYTRRSVHTLRIPSLRSLYLWSVKIQDRDSVQRPLLTNMDRLQRLELRDVRLGDRGLGLTPHMTDLQVIKLRDVRLGDRGLVRTPHMTDLQRVVLYRVSMPQSGWGRLIQSVIDIHHQFVVRLRDTDIDSDFVSTLYSSPHISVTRDIPTSSEQYNGRGIGFTRVWPLTQDTQ